MRGTVLDRIRADFNSDKKDRSVLWLSLVTYVMVSDVRRKVYPIELGYRSQESTDLGRDYFQNERWYHSGF